jgi:SnoaL-like protein
MVYVDHRLAGAGVLRGGAAMIEYHKVLVEVAPSHRITARRMVVGSGRVTLSESVSTSDNTGTFGASERVTHIVAAMAPNGLVTRMEQFDEGDGEAARARLAELAAANPFDDNLAMDGSRRWFTAMVDADWDSVSDLLHPDFVLEDRRPMFGSIIDGRDASLEWNRATVALGLTGVTLEGLAFRGDRLVLVQRTWHAADFELTSLCLIEVDQSGRCQWSALYDPDQLEDALDDLDARFLQREGAPYVSWLHPNLAAFRRAHNEHDFATLRRLYRHDVVMVDRRPTGAGVIEGVDAVMAFHQAMAEVVPSHRLIIRRFLALGDHLELVESVSSGEATEAGAGAHEIVRLIVALLDENGLVARYEHFAPADEAAARARFDELGGVG